MIHCQFVTNVKYPQIKVGFSNKMFGLVKQGHQS